MVKKVKLRYADDYFFKKIMSQDKEGAKSLIKAIIKGATSVVAKEIIIKNPFREGEVYTSKDLILDVVCIDEYDNYYDIEMQTTSMKRGDKIRFLKYIARLYGEDIDRGEEYNKKPRKTIQIIFVNNIIESNKLITVLKYQSDDNYMLENEYDFKTYLISMPYINQMNREKLSNFENIVYLFQNDKVNDKMKPSKEIEYIMNEHDIFTEEDYKRKAEYDEKLLETINKWQAYFDYEDAKQEGARQKELQFLQKLLSKEYSDDEIIELMNIDEERLKELKQLL